MYLRPLSTNYQQMAMKWLKLKLYVAPAKGVGWVTGARVQISPSPPKKVVNLVCEVGGLFIYNAHGY